MRTLRSNVVLLLFALILFAQCKTKKVTPRANNYAQLEEHGPKEEFDYDKLPTMISNLNVKYNFHKSGITDTFNQIIEHYLISDFRLDKFDVNVSLEKNGPATLEFSERDVLINLPLSISIIKSSVLGDISANGALEMKFISTIDIDEEWNLLTATQLSDYEWTQAPRLNLGIGALPIEKIASAIIDRAKPNLEEQIDQSIKEQFYLRKRVLNVLQYIETPIEIDTIIEAWMQIHPEQISMTGAYNTEDWTSGILEIKGETKLSSEKPEEKIPGIILPKFEWADALADESKLLIYLDASYKKIDAAINTNFVGKTFREGDKEILIRDVRLEAEDDRLVFHTDVTGSFNGEIIVKAKPLYDDKKESFYADDIDIQVKTNNLIHKAAAWMLKGKIKSKLQEMTHFSIQNELAGLQAQINQQIKKYNKEDELQIKLDINNIQVNKFLTEVDRIVALVELELVLAVDIYDFTTFSRMNVNPPLKN